MLTSVSITESTSCDEHMYLIWRIAKLEWIFFFGGLFVRFVAVFTATTVILRCGRVSRLEARQPVVQVLNVRFAVPRTSFHLSLLFPLCASPP